MPSKEIPSDHLCGVKATEIMKWRELSSNWFTTNNIITFNHRRHSHIHGSGTLRLAFTVHTHHSAVRPHKYLGALSNFGGKSQRKIQLGSRLQFLVKDEVNAPRGNIPRLPIMRRSLFVHGHTNNHRKGQIVPASQTTLRHPQCSSHITLPRTKIPTQGSRQQSGFQTFCIPAIRDARSVPPYGKSNQRCAARTTIAADNQTTPFLTTKSRGLPRPSKRDTLCQILAKETRKIFRPRAVATFETLVLAS